MKKTVRVTIEKEIEIEIKEELLTEEYLQEVSKFFGNEYDVNKLFELAAIHCADGYWCFDIEGIGEASQTGTEADTEVKYRMMYEDENCEIIG